MPKRPAERFEFSQGMASKAAEQALRIALVLQLFEDPDAAEVGERMMQAGAVLARWYANEWLRVTSVPQVPRLNAVSQRVLEWLLRNFQPAAETFTARSIYTAKVGGVHEARRCRQSVVSAREHRSCRPRRKKLRGSPGDGL